MPIRPTRVLVAVADAILVLSAVVGVGVPVAHFAGWLEQLPWLTERIPVLTLLVVSLVLIDVVLERRLRLEALLHNLAALQQSRELGVRYLPDAESAEATLVEVARRARQSIFAVGAKSHRQKYLNAVSKAVKEHKLMYYRLLEGLYITHQLHDHLAALINLPNVKIAWTPHEKYANLCVTESDTVLAFPSPWADRYSALALPGAEFAQRYTEYFVDAFAAAVIITSEQSLQVLCHTCGRTTERTPDGIAALLRKGTQK